MTDLSFGQGFLASMFVILVVFVVLLCLWILIRLFSVVVRVIEKVVVAFQSDGTSS